VLVARVLAIVIAGVCGVSVARADTVGDLEAKGEELAKDGRFTEAIDTFKQADRFVPRASHACLIALAYTRREAWSQAELFFALCHQRTRPGDPLPDWLPKAEAQLAERLATANVALVDVKIEPANAHAFLTVSSFAPDEEFEPRKVHLTLGTHLITVKADGWETAGQSVTITSRDETAVVIKLHRVGEHPAEPVARVSRVSSPVPWIVIGGGGAVGLVGVIFHVTQFRDAYNALNTAANDQVYKMKEGKYDTDRLITAGLYGVSAITIGIGVVLKYTTFRDREVPVQVVVNPVSGGGVISVEWWR
jgi:hypothetical protein